MGLKREGGGRTEREQKDGHEAEGDEEAGHEGLDAEEGAQVLHLLALPQLLVVPRVCRRRHTTSAACGEFRVDPPRSGVCVGGVVRRDR